MICTMSDDQDKPLMNWEQARELAHDLNPDDFDDAVIHFLDELLSAQPDYALLQQAATLLLQDEVDLSPDLRECGIEPDEQLIEIFILAGADVDARNAFGETPLTLAARYGYEELAAFLLSVGASKQRRNAQGKIPADVACSPALIDLLMPEDKRALDGALASDEESLPDYMEDGDLEAPEGLADELLRLYETRKNAEAAQDERFAPRHDCGLGE